MLTKDYLEILELLTAHDAEFVIVGAYAMGVFGYTRATGDIDIFVKPSQSNAIKVAAALAEFGAPSDKITADDFSKPNTVFQIGVAPLRIDFLTSIDGVQFEDVRPVSSDLGGITVPVIDFPHLLKNKQSTGRLRDLADAEELKKRHNTQTTI